MADNNNDPFDHPVKKNNWWMYILGGLCFAGLIIWFFIDWSYKDRNKEDVNGVPPVEQTVPVEAVENLPDVQVDAEAPADSLPEVEAPAVSDEQTK